PSGQLCCGRQGGVGIAMGRVGIDAGERKGGGDGIDTGERRGGGEWIDTGERRGGGDGIDAGERPSAGDVGPAPTSVRINVKPEKWVVPKYLHASGLPPPHIRPLRHSQTL